MRDVLSALAYLHKDGIIHRDLKVSLHLWARSAVCVALPECTLNGYQSTVKIVLIKPPDMQQALLDHKVQKGLQGGCASTPYTLFHLVPAELSASMYSCDWSLLSLGRMRSPYPWVPLGLSKDSPLHAAVPCGWSLHPAILHPKHEPRTLGPRLGQTPPGSCCSVTHESVSPIPLYPCAAD